MMFGALCYLEFHGLKRVGVTTEDGEQVLLRPLAGNLAFVFHNHAGRGSLNIRALMVAQAVSQALRLREGAAEYTMLKKGTAGSSSA